MIRGLQFLQRESHDLKELVATQGEKIAKQDDMILQLTCKVDLLKKLKDRDHDKVPKRAVLICNQVVVLHHMVIFLVMGSCQVKRQLFIVIPRRCNPLKC